MSEIKNSMAEVIISYLKDRYPNAKTTITKEVVVKALEHYSDSELYEKSIELFVFEDLMGTFRQIGADNCNVTIDDFNKFMDGEKARNLMDLHNVSWIDLLYATMRGDMEACKSVRDAIIPPVKNPIDLDAHYRNLRVQENCIEIALQCFEEISRTIDMPRDIIVGKIQDWALQAEKLWEERDDDDYTDYYDFIDDFTEKKKTEYLAGFNSSLTNNTDDDEKASQIAGKYAMEYTFDGSIRCTYEEVKEAIEGAIKEYSKNN